MGAAALNPSQKHKNTCGRNALTGGDPCIGQRTRSVRLWGFQERVEEKAGGVKGGGVYKSPCTLSLSILHNHLTIPKVITPGWNCMTAKTKTQRFKRLISHGFFAPELPPCFVSDDLAKYRETIWKSIENVPKQQKNAQFSGAKQFLSQPSSFYFPRFGKDDRKHGVLNPVSFLGV